MGQVYGEGLWLPAYIFVYWKQAVNADEVNKPINWVHQFKTASFVDHLCYFCPFLLCVRARLFIGALWSPAGKGMTSWLSFVMAIVNSSLSHWYSGSGVVFDCLDS